MHLMRAMSTTDGNTGKAPISLTTGEFGSRVRSRRTELGYSQEKLAEKAGLHWTFIGQVERGQRNLTLHNVVKLSVALQTDPGELVRGLKV